MSKKSPDQSNGDAATQDSGFSDDESETSKQKLLDAHGKSFEELIKIGLKTPPPAAEPREQAKARRNRRR